MNPKRTFNARHIMVRYWPVAYVAVIWIVFTVGRHPFAPTWWLMPSTYGALALVVGLPFVWYRFGKTDQVVPLVLITALTLGYGVFQWVTGPASAHRLETLRHNGTYYRTTVITWTWDGRWDVSVDACRSFGLRCQRTNVAPLPTEIETPQPEDYRATMLFDEEERLHICLFAHGDITLYHDALNLWDSPRNVEPTHPLCNP